jgi:hypothetical protein
MCLAEDKIKDSIVFEREPWVFSVMNFCDFILSGIPVLPLPLWGRVLLGDVCKFPVVGFFWS